MTVDFDYPFSQQGQAVADSATQLFERAKSGLLSVVSAGANTAFPANPQPWEIRNRTDLGGRYMWHPVAESWVRIGPLAVDYTFRAETVFEGAMEATTTLYVPSANFRRSVEAIVIVSDTSTTSDGSNHWQFDLYNVTDSVSVFSATPTTNGSELVANEASEFAADQNKLLDALDVMELRITKTGSATDATRALISMVSIVAA